MEGISPVEVEISIPLHIRFGEVDSMGIVWHGNYAKYFEDVREAYSKEAGIGYMDFYSRGFYTPMVELNCKYKYPLRYGEEYMIGINYEPSRTAKIVFRYYIWEKSSGRICTEGVSTQVIINLQYELQLVSPEFYIEWQKKYIA